MTKLKHWVYSTNRTKKYKKEQLIHALKKSYINKKIFLRRIISNLNTYKYNLKIYKNLELFI